MKIFIKNILSNDVLKAADAVCFTSNEVIKKDGKLVMGAGVAKQFRDTFPGLDQEAGTSVKKYGNACKIIRSMHFLGTMLEIIAFPTKGHWKNPSDIKLIRQSALELLEMANKHGWKQVYLPAPGVGLGGLSWKNEVKPLLEKILDDRFIVTFLSKKGLT